jgi:hypothetical protein
MALKGVQDCDRADPSKVEPELPAVSPAISSFWPTPGGTGALKKNGGSSAGTSLVLTKRGNGFSRRAGRAALIAAICVRSWEPRHVPPDRIECVRWKRPIFRLRSAVSRCDALRSSGLKPKYREATDRLCRDRQMISLLGLLATLENTG